jgi:hypothetical protein
MIRASLNATELSERSVSFRVGPHLALLHDAYQMPIWSCAFEYQATADGEERHMASSCWSILDSVTQRQADYSFDFPGRSVT